MLKRLIGIPVAVAVLGILMINSSACSNDKLPEPQMVMCGDTVTFDNQIQPIIAASCALVGCHDGSGGAPGDYTSYALMLPNLDNGQVQDRVIDQMDMPIAPISISADEFELIRCWLEAGHPEK
ncbi:MAG: hypothetical protein AAGG75_06770 [Bacteroidota bacterium]